MTGTTTPQTTTAPAGTDERTVFVLADEALLAVVRQVREDQWDLRTRGVVTTSDPGSDPTLRELVGYHAYDDAWVPAMLAGRTMAEVGEDAHRGDLLGADPVAAFERIAQDAIAAARALDDLDRTVHCSFGDYSARDYLWQVISFRALRAVEIARLIGVDDRLEPALVDPLLSYLRVHAEEWRAWGVFGPALPAPQDASAQEELLALTGRRPR
ncbi:DinB family protein [Kineococcus esterisolvens]|uniref:TIGR03086 family metal-binding protein n=1 Tax=unclassified Kineococcus TaxID=2621656 RepID=UPI003D7D0787